MGSRSILIVEDDDDLSLALAVRLQASGYRVATSPDAIVALQAVRRNEPDLVVLDLGLPGGGGLTFLKRLRSLTSLPFIPVIVLTASAGSEETALAAGAQAYFEKPPDNEALLAAVRAQVGAPDGS